MLAAAARRIATIDRCPRIELIHADILEWRSPAAHYDRAVTHILLDLFKPYRICRIVQKISRLATEEPFLNRKNCEVAALPTLRTRPTHF
jgi:hypothetical protein